MITSGKSDKRQMNSNKIKIFMYIKIQMYQKEKYIYALLFSWQVWGQISLYF